MVIKSLPLAISVIWPATGFSLAALLLFGFNAWPGIFFGNFLYNFVNLYLNNPTIIGPFITALFIAIGSSSQAILGGYIMRRYTSTGYFETPKDIFIFLIPATFLTNFVASSIGIATLHVYGKLMVICLIFASYL